MKGDYQIAAPVLAGLRRYTILDLGCGYGRLAPFLSSFDCRQYIGMDSQERRVYIAERRYGHRGGGCCIDFQPATAFGLHPSWHGIADVVWTSNVLQHLTIPDKLRLVETMKACRAPKGICLLCEEEIWDRPRIWCEGRYASAEQPRHMIPVPAHELCEAFRPLVLRHLGGNVWQATEE